MRSWSTGYTDKYWYITALKAIKRKKYFKCNWEKVTDTQRNLKGKKKIAQSRQKLLLKENWYSGNHWEILLKATVLELIIRAIGKLPIKIITDILRG